MSALPRQRQKVLVVDDEPDLADLAQALLNHHGFDALVAYSASEALGILANEHGVDAVFSDVTMPGMTGLELARVLSDIQPHIKIVLTSGYTSPAHLAGHGNHLFAAKPYSIDTVVRLLRC